MHIEAAIRARLADSDNVGMGTQCLFVSLDETWGVKLYAHELERDAARVCQEIGHENDVAPEVGESFDIPMPRTEFRPDWWPLDLKPERLFGYFTQIARTLRCECDSNSCESDCWEKSDAVSRELRRTCKELGFWHVGDLSSNNIGELPNGQYVVIDWDARFFGRMALTNKEIRSLQKITTDPGLYRY